MCFGNPLLGERECVAQKIKTALRKETNMGLSQLREHTEWYNIVQSDALEAGTRISVERELWLYISDRFRKSHREVRNLLDVTKKQPMTFAVSGKNLGLLSDKQRVTGRRQEQHRIDPVLCCTITPF